jgi:hypothetical protein
MKRGAGILAAHLFRSKCYPIFGVARGLCSLDTKSTLLLPSFQTPLDPPKNLKASPHILFQIKEAHEPKAGFLTIAHGTALNKGGVLTPKGMLCETFLPLADGKKPNEHDLFQLKARNFFPKIATSYVPVVTICSPWQGAFFHWLFEVLPQLHLVEKAKIKNYCLFAERKEKFQKESLRLLDISALDVIDASQFDGVKAPQIISLSKPASPSQFGVHFLRQKFLPLLTLRKKRRLYISRNDAGRRRVKNEEELAPLLEKYGFEKVLMGHLPFLEQMQLFFSAEAVIAPHGAALSHLAFCDRGTPVIELFSPHYIKPCYWHLSNIAKLPYSYCLGKASLTGENPDMIIDPKELELTL